MNGSLTHDFTEFITGILFIHFKKDYTSKTYYTRRYYYENTKNFPLFLLTFVLIFFACLPVHAESIEPIQTEIEYLENGDYMETVLIVYPTYARASTRSGSKTSYYKNSSGTTLWSVTVTASFSYTKGKSSKCTSVTGSSSSSSSNWKVSSATSSKSGNKASATATGTLYQNSVAINSYTRTATLTCDTNGNLS